MEAKIKGFFENIDQRLPNESIVEKTIMQFFGEDKSSTTPKMAVINKTEDNIGLQNDVLFLLSVDEYEKYKNVIPNVQTRWWLRCKEQGKVAFVTAVGESFIGQDIMARNQLGVRPALRFKPDKFMDQKNIGYEFSYHNRPFTKIARNIAIATIPIGFGKFDDKSTDYIDSLIKKVINEWDLQSEKK